MSRPAAVFARWSWSLALAGCVGWAATASRAVDEGGVADGARATTQASATREAFLATQPSWLRPDPFPPDSAAAKAASRPSPNLKPAAKPHARPVEAITRVVVVSIDGLRPDLLLLGDAPNARKLMARGVYSMWAQTTPQSITLPSHVSMLTGVTPNRHGILWNSDLPLEYALYPNVPTLFEAAKRHGYTTAVAAGKDKFDAFDRPGVLDWRWIPSKGAVKTAAVVGPACDILRRYKPNAMLVHFPSVDSAGHTYGWGSPEYMKAVADADAALGQLVAAIDEAGLTDSTLMIMSADHGGALKGHGPEDVRSRNIPWIAVGPGLRKGYDLSLNVKQLVKTEDTFATACWALGIPPTAANLDGTPVKAIVAPPPGEELMKPSTKPAAAW